MQDENVPITYRALNVQELHSTNKTDTDGNPTGGEVVGPGLTIHWQNGPRTPDESGKLAPSNGAFVEDAIYAAMQRLMFFQKSKYATDQNESAIQCLHEALTHLDVRRQERSQRGVEGQHKV